MHESRQRVGHGIFGGLSLLLAACAGASPGAHDATPAPSAPSDPAPLEPSASAAPATASSEPATAPPSPFQPVVELPVSAHLFAVKGALLVVEDVEAARVGESPGIRIGVVENDKLTFPERLFFPTSWSIVAAVIGTWPDKLELLATGTTGRTGIAEKHSLGKKGWEYKGGAESYGFAGIAMVGTSVLALHVPSMLLPGSRAEIVAVRGTGARELTATDKAACAKTLSADDMTNLQSTEVLAFTFGGTGAGTVFALGPRCTGELGIETWPSGSKKSTITSFPASTGIADEGTRVAPGPDDQAWVFADKLLHYDGKGWSIVDGPRVTNGVVARDGTLWAVAEKGTLHRRVASAFEPVAVPSNAPVDDIAIADDGTIWIEAGGALLRTRKPSDGASAVKVAATAPPKHAPPPRPKPGSPACKSNLVVLYGFTKVTPDDYDFPLSRKALKGHSEFGTTRFVVTRDAGQKFFSALVPTFAEGQKIAAVIEKGVQGSKPQIVCATPEVIRDVKIDLRTGEIVK